MRIAACQFQMVWEDIESSKKRALEWIHKGKEQGVEFIAFPEMALSGFSMNGEQMVAAYENVPKWLASISKKYHMSIGMGLVVKGKEGPENHFMVYNNLGELVFDYGKIHLFTRAGEAKVYHAGAELCYGMVGQWPVGALICYDLRFGEIFRFLSRKAHLIVVPANWPKFRSEQWCALLQARAVENQCYIMGVNCVGEYEGVQYVGESRIITPKGEIIASLNNEEGLVIADIDDNVAYLRNRFCINESRREGLYQELRQKWEDNNG